MNLPKRKSPRLQTYDYSQNAAYFVTICVQNRRSLFGVIRDDEMVSNEAGEMIAHYWLEVSQKFAMIQLDLFVVIPNHFHGILFLDSTQELFDEKNTKVVQDPKMSLPDIIGWFKTMTTNHYIRGVKDKQWQCFEGQLWQRSYHDHILRDEIDLNRVRAYTLTNPQRWQEDSLRLQEPS